MPIHTRSTTKKLIELGNGTYAFTSVSETGEGIHTRFEYSDPHKSTKALCPSAGSLSSGSSLSTIDSATSFTSFLSSFSSDSSSIHSGRQLQRTSAERWIRDPESGVLHISFEGPSIQTSNGGSEQADDDHIFEREYQTAMENRDYMADLTRKLIAREELDEDIAYDTYNMFTATNRPPVEWTPQVASEPKGKRLGPEGTELIDETFRPPPAEPAVYPQQWITQQSNHLRSEPTELIIS